MEEINDGGIASVKGIYCLGENIGIKKEKKDFAVIYSDRIANAAGVFTRNDVKGAPVIVSSKKLKKGKAQAIIINSGISNVCTGAQGIEDVLETARLASIELGISEKYVLVSSTGIIGAYLPMERIRKGISGMKDRLGKNSRDAAEAILTTDKSIKKIAVRIGNITIGAIAKCSGMINPNMATMLAFIATDADIESGELREMIKNAVNKSFNMITVDNDTSTSDSVILLANGIAGKTNSSKFQSALDYVCKYLAKCIARDGEGATKLVEINVKNAKTEKQASLVAKSIAGSNLVKSALYGNDPNWGRIMCAAGYARTGIEQNKINIFVGDEKIISSGIATAFDKERISGMLKNDPVVISIELNLGNKQATAYGCDLTYEYVKINAEYHT